jgi:hypothetical protein
MSATKIVIAVVHVLAFEDGTSSVELIHTYEPTTASAHECLVTAAEMSKRMNKGVWCEVTYDSNEVGPQVGYYD